MIRPLPIKFGIGFSVSDEDQNQYATLGYRNERIGIHDNYYVTEHMWEWPHEITFPEHGYIIDGFSPNLNKSLHAGHLRNLAIANSLKQILAPKKSNFVALLGASLGVKKHALDGWKYWNDFLGYHPKEYFDITLPDDIVETRLEEDIDSEYYNTHVWDGPDGPVVVKRSDGRPVYAYYDLAFSKYVSPTHYITGSEQKEHFQKLGLDKKHLPMGLVLGEDNKKLKSRTGDALLAMELIELVSDRIEGDSISKTKLSWNILAWNFLRVNREKNIKFEVEKWTRPDQGGLYISYTYARAKSALNKAEFFVQQTSPGKVSKNISDIDLLLLGFSDQYKHYFQQSINHLDPVSIANFSFELAKLIGQSYEKEKLSGGRESFKKAFSHATWCLGNCIQKLGMFILDEV